MKFSTNMPAPYPKRAAMVAGMGQTDLTPPPGYPMAGYSINGRISRGYWVHPKATALYIRDTAGTPFVFVATDLWGISDGQKLAVLKLLSNNDSTKFIGESDLLLSATHSHHSLGVNVPDDAFALSSIGFGFDIAAFDFTVKQIAAAIRMAIGSAGPATVSFASGVVDSIAKNRSVNAYLRNNPNERREYFHNLPAMYRADVTKEEIESMIDKHLTTITVKNMSEKVMGILASYPVHPTATGDETEVYSADIFGLASARASDSLPDKPIVAFYNGAEGDVAPEYTCHNRSDAVRIAEKLSAAIIKVTKEGKPTVMDGPITHRINIIEIASHKVAYNPLDENCYCKLPDAFVSTDKKAIVGTSSFGGASDGRTSLSSFGISEGIKSDTWDPYQGYKMPAVKFLFTNVIGQNLPKLLRGIAIGAIKNKPVSRVPISIHKVGPMRFVGMPGEFTTMLGRRIKKTVAEQCHTIEDNISLVGLADGYISYVTTPCEYNEQAYEGGSNYFGTATGQVFVKEYEVLAGKGEGNLPQRNGRKEVFNIGSLVEFGPRHIEKLQTWDGEERLQNILYADNGAKLHSHFILPGVYTKDTADIAPDEAVAYTFEDTVNEISSNKNFYPYVYLETENGDSIPLPEHIITLDKYAGGHATWTVRILDISKLDDTPVKFIIEPLSVRVPYQSAYFRKPH